MAFLIALAALAMIGFGLPSGVLSVAWPSMSDTFGVAVTSLGSVVAAYTIGYTISSFSSGWLLRMSRLGTFLTFSAALSGIGYISFAIVSDWWLLLAVSAVAGAGHGYLDTGINLFAATRLNARTTNWLHAFFGVGSLTGSSLMTGILLVGMIWQWGYVIVAVPFMILVFGFIATGKRWHSGRAESAEETDPAVGVFQTLRVSGVWMGITAFVVHTAVEVIAGVWTFTLLTEERGLSVAAAGIWVTAYFGGLVAGRVTLGSFAARISLTRLLRLCGVLTLVGALGFWQTQSVELGFVGLVLLGFGLGPVFPTLVSATPSYVGVKHTQNAMGIQMGASAIGGGLIPAGVGFIAAVAGLEIVSISMVIGGVLMLGVLWTFNRFITPDSA